MGTYSTNARNGKWRGKVNKNKNFLFQQNKKNPMLERLQVFSMGEFGGKDLERSRKYS